MIRDKRLEEITDTVYRLQSDPSNTDLLWQLVLLGHQAFKAGLGLPPDLVRTAVNTGVIMTGKGVK